MHETKQKSRGRVQWGGFSPCLAREARQRSPFVRFLESIKAGLCFYTPRHKVDVLAVQPVPLGRMFELRVKELQTGDERTPA